MKPVCATLILLCALLLWPSVALANTGSAGLALCAYNSAPPPFDTPSFVPWGRTVEVPYVGVDTEFTNFWEIWQNGGLLFTGNGVVYVGGDSSFLETPDKGTSSSSYDVKWQLFTDGEHYDFSTYPSVLIPGCYREGVITIPTGLGKRPRLSVRLNSDSNALRLESSAALRPVGSCNAVRLAPGYIDVRRGKGKWISRKVSDVCTLNAINRKSIFFGKGLTMRFPSTDDDYDSYEHWSPTLTVGLRGPSHESVALRVRGGGQTFTQKLAIQRIDRPDRKVWAGTDEYWNYCVNEGQKVYAKNGNYYCWKIGFDDIRVRKVK
jgi:hypothetical protein